MYVYKMYEGDDLRYVGHTIHMYGRMSMHVGKASNWPHSKVLSVEQARSVTKVLYAEMGSSDARILEAYLIAKYKPAWNKDFVEGDDLTFELSTGELEWKEWPVTWDDNPGHHIFVWKGKELLYEIPKVHSVYDELCKELGIEQDMNFGYSSPVYVGDYKLMRLSGHRRIKTGAERQIAKCSFMGYPEAFDGE